MSAASRGWGPGWPNCQYSKWVTITLSNGQRLSVRGEISFLVKGLCEETMRRGYGLVNGWCWGSACRAIRGTSTASNHSWGLAVDLNAPNNPMSSKLITDMPRWMVDLWERYGFRWGGRYRTRPDAMHYEYMGTPADAKRHTDQFFADLAKPSPTPTPPPEEDDDMQQLIIKGRTEAEWWITDGRSKSHVQSRADAQAMAFVGFAKLKKNDPPEPFVLDQGFVDRIPTIVAADTLAEMERRLASKLSGSGTGLTEAAAKRAAKEAITEVLRSV